ncbi:hypothetical protein CRG98_004828 [Punica granatum]|uniref:Retrotransposon gag domain-containing protein n=1 Tax=Punica granatum TaxID=22663 RepID=A0A2I0L2I4_PUNGR|nr:hypothetical protein CRG98_004828 [Punica granatum]
MLFPYSSNLIDGALAQVILQVVGGHSYVEAILAETIRHRRQTFQTQRAQSKEPCTQSYKSLEQSEIDSAANLWIFVQNSLITESFRAPSNVVDPVRFTALEEMDQNRASSSHTPPPERRTTVHMNPVDPPIYVMDSKDMSFSAMTYVPTDYEEFVIQTFQDCLTGSALDWFITLKAGDIPTWTDLSQKFFDQYRFCAETPPTLLDLSMTEMRESQTFEAYATEWRGKAAKHIPPITERQQVQLFHSTLRGAYYSHLLAHTSSFSDLIEAGKKMDMGVKLGRIEARQGRRTERHRRNKPLEHPGETKTRLLASSILDIRLHSRFWWTTPLHYRLLRHMHIPCIMCSLLKRRRLISRPRQLLSSRNLRNSSGPSVNMINIAAIEEEEDSQKSSIPFVINYAPVEVAFAPIPFVIEVPAKEPYHDSRVPWTYESEVASAELEMSAMGITRSGRVYQGPEPVDKGKAPATAFSTIPEAVSFPTKKVTDQEAKAFMKVIKASDYKVVEQMGKSPAHISLFALLLNSEPHRNALLKVLTAAQIMGGTSDTPITETDDFSSDAVEPFLALSAIYAVTEETSSRVHIRPVREDEELTNWTSVPLYLAIVADV